MGHQLVQQVYHVCLVHHPKRKSLAGLPPGYWSTYPTWISGLASTLQSTYPLWISGLASILEGTYLHYVLLLSSTPHSHVHDENQQHGDQRGAGESKDKWLEGWEGESKVRGLDIWS